MTGLKDILLGLHPIEGDTLRITAPPQPANAADAAAQPPAGSALPLYAAIDPGSLRVEAAAHSRARLVILHTRPDAESIDIALAEGAHLFLTQIFMAEAFAQITIHQAERSVCRTTMAQLTSANASYTIDLDAPDADNTLNGVFLAADDEHCVIKLRTNHNAPLCSSNSNVKGVAAGCSTGEFHGMVYVAPDAQHTDARQQSRNVLLSDQARITTDPQLEIYADDVKCTHGATIGLIDSDAILYMRQRGLSEQQARRLQIEGFVSDVVRHCDIEPLCGALRDAISAKMEKL